MIYKYLLTFLFWLAVVLLAFISCQPVPEVVTRPLLKSSWDTVGNNKQLLIPGDSLRVTADLASQTEFNTLYITAHREVLPFVEFEGPDSDFVFHQPKSIFGKITTGVQQLVPIPHGLRPGKYLLNARAKDNDGRWSDTIKSSFFLNRLEYPVLLMRKPIPDGGVTTIIRDTARFQFAAAGIDLAYLQFQWFDSTRSIALSASSQLNLSGTNTVIELDTFLNTNSILVLKMNLKLLLRNTAGRQMFYWLPYKKQL